MSVMSALFSTSERFYSEDAYETYGVRLDPGYLPEFKALTDRDGPMARWRKEMRQELAAAGLL